MTTAVAGRHELAVPSVSDFRATVEQGGGDAVLWSRLCQQAGVSAASPTLSLDQLDVLAQTIKAQPGVLGIMGRSLAVRVTTYRTLSRLNGAAR